MADLGERIVEYLSEDTNGVKIGIYTLSGVLFGVAYIKKRPITKFRKPQQIPNAFVRDKLRQQGTVAGIEMHMQSGPLMQINHRPPVSLFSRNGGPYLPVKVAGVTINSNGLSWLQTVCDQKHVEFIPLAKHQNYVDCLVFLRDKPHKEVDVAEALLSLGFAHTNNLPLKVANDKKLEHYYKLLTTVEKSARRSREGEWQWKIPPPMFPISVCQKLWHRALFNIMPTARRLPALVRD